MKRLSLVAWATLLGLACAPAARGPARATPVPGDSRLSVYLQALPRTTDRLAFRIRALSLVRAGGETLPLVVHLAQIDGGTMERERLLASGPLPAGSYAGFDLEIEAASLGPAGSRAPLAVDPGPWRIDVPFDVGRRRGVVLSLRFEAAESLRDGVAFEPVFSGEVPVQAPTGVIALASSRDTDTLTLFDKITGRVFGVVATGRAPSGMVFAPLTRRVYVALEGDDSIEVIAIDQQSVIQRLRLQAGDDPRELALTPDGRTLLVANSGSNSISFVDPDGLFEIDRVSVGNGPSSILVDARGRRAYVFNSHGDSISILDVPGRAVVGTIRTEAEPLRGQFSPEGDRLYVIHRISPSMLVVDPATMTVLNRIYVRAAASAIKVDPRTGWIYLGWRAGLAIEVFEPDAFLPVGTIPTRGGVSYLTIDGEAANLLCVVPRPPRVRSISMTSQRVLMDIDLGADPYWVTTMGER